MSSSDHIVLAASGSSAARTAEEHALDHCKRNGLKHISVVHVTDTHLVHYGEVDQLAPGSSKAEYIDYINDDAREVWESLQLRLEKEAEKNDIEIIWYHLQGDPLDQLLSFVENQSVDKLIVGSGAKPPSFFSPRKIIADRLVTNCDCEVSVIPAS